MAGRAASGGKGHGSGLAAAIAGRRGGGRVYVRAPGCAWWAAVLVARGALAEARGGSLIGSVWMLSLAALIGRPAHVTKRDTVDSSQAPHGFL